MECILQPQWNQTRNQQKKDKRKIFRFLETKHNLLNNPWVKEEILRDTKKYTELNGNENTTYQSMWER